MKRSVLYALGLAIAALGPASCSDAPEEAAPTPQASTRAAAEPQAGQAQPWSDPDAPAGIEVSEGRLMLPAVSGNPGAVYFTIRNMSDADQEIRSAWVAGAATAMLHETQTQGGTARMRHATQVPLPTGETVRFAPGGLHIMAMDIGETLEVGGQTEVTLTFASGDKVSFPAEVRAPGDAGG